MPLRDSVVSLCPPWGALASGAPCLLGHLGLGSSRDELAVLTGHLLSYVTAD